MKKCKKSILGSVIIGSLCFLGVNILAANSKNEAAYLERYQTLMQTMKTGMESAPKTGDAAIAYLYQMLHHHEADIIMSQSVLKYGQNQKVKQIAKKIIKDHAHEVAMMKELIKKMEANPNLDTEQEEEYMIEFIEFYTRMKLAMESVKPTGNVDKEFLKQMIPHHDAAVNISRVVLRHTKNPEVRKMARNAIKSQTADIKDMSKLIKEVS
ncbi:MAG: hypothetical protein K0S71_2321 [Clostridia bacterium]|jgi:uncharacterized protein (DUF305 family)|nr:hypothetical protein [Clostridia bacterium]